MVFDPISFTKFHQVCTMHFLFLLFHRKTCRQKSLRRHTEKCMRSKQLNLSRKWY